jgi:hypothetical protein
MSPDHCEGGSPSTAGWLIPPSCCRLEERCRAEQEEGPNGRNRSSIVIQAGGIPEVQSQSHDGPRNNKNAGFAMVADWTRIDDDYIKATVVERRRENCMGAT